MPVIYYATEIHLDFGILSTLGMQCRTRNLKRPLLVTDSTIAANGMMARAIAALGDIDHAVFAEAHPNPMEAAVSVGVDVYVKSGCDSLIALGGGSVIDTAKAIGLITSNGGKVEDYGGPGKRDVCLPLPTIIAIPTIAGSGSEVSRGLGVGVGQSGAKVNVLHPLLFPTLALCDPDLTASVPAHHIAVSSFDALSHCIEGYLSPRVNPPIAAVCLDGLSRIWRNIETAVTQPADSNARWEMMMGSIEGGMALPKGLGAAHSLAIPLDQLHLQHGAIIAALLPKVIRWYGSSLDHKRAALLNAIGLPADSDLADAIESVAARIGLATSLRALGVPREIFPEIASSALVSPYHEILIRPAGKQDYIEILESAF